MIKDDCFLRFELSQISWNSFRNVLISLSDSKMLDLEYPCYRHDMWTVAETQTLFQYILNHTNSYGSIEWRYVTYVLPNKSRKACTSKWNRMYQQQWRINYLKIYSYRLRYAQNEGLNYAAIVLLTLGHSE